MHVFYLIKKPKRFFLLRMPPGPVSIPILGGFIAIDVDVGRMPQAFTAIAQKYGNIFSVQRPSGR